MSCLLSATMSIPKGFDDTADISMDRGDSAVPNAFYFQAGPMAEPSKENAAKRSRSDDEDDSDARETKRTCEIGK